MRRPEQRERKVRMQSEVAGQWFTSGSPGMVHQNVLRLTLFDHIDQDTCSPV